MAILMSPKPSAPRIQRTSSILSSSTRITSNSSRPSVDRSARAPPAGRDLSPLPAERRQEAAASPPPMGDFRIKITERAWHSGHDLGTQSASNTAWVGRPTFVTPDMVC